MRQTAVGKSIWAVHGPDAALASWPIPKELILSGNPKASGQILWQSDDKRLLNGIWECAPGAFNWVYTWDETVYVIKGKLTVTDESGGSTSLGAGDLFFVRAGTRSTWKIAETVRKAFHIRSDTPVEF